MLEQTLELLTGQDPATVLREALAGTALPKPADHKAGSLADMFRLSMNPGEIEAVVAVVKRAVASGTTTSGTASRGLGGFLEAWQEYLRFAQSGAQQQ